jgi:hypothetical protein
MNCNDQDRQCVVTPPRMSRSPERSEGEGPVSMDREILRCAQDDRTGVDCYNSSSRPGWGRHSPFGTPCYTIYKSETSPACLIPSRLTTNREANRPFWYQSPSGTAFRSSSFFFSEKDFTMGPEQLEHTALRKMDFSGQAIIARFGSCFSEGSFTAPSCDSSARASLSTGVSFRRNSP